MKTNLDFGDFLKEKDLSNSQITHIGLHSGYFRGLEKPCLMSE